MVYIWVKLDEKSNSVAFQANLISHVWHLQCNNLPHEHELTPGGAFTRSTCASKPLAHKAAHAIPTMYYRHALHFPLVSISSCFWTFWRKVKICENFKNLLGELIVLKTITFSYSHPSSSNFPMQIWFEVFFIRHNGHNYCLPIFFLL